MATYTSELKTVDEELNVFDKTKRLQTTNYVNIASSTAPKKRDDKKNEPKESSLGYIKETVFSPFNRRKDDDNSYERPPQDQTFFVQSKKEEKLPSDSHQNKPTNS